jgi:carbamoylphosphate synthase large subunit
MPSTGRGPRALCRAGDKLKLKQPANGIARSREEAIAVANRIGYPVLMRPSYVLGGRAMEIVDGQAQLENISRLRCRCPGDSPVLIDQYLRDAIEVDVDAICDGDDVVVAGVLQHIEEAGVHSGDSACSLPPYSLPATSSRRSAAGRCAGAGLEGARADEHPVRGEGAAARTAL